MNIHKNARTTPQSRALLVHRVLRRALAGEREVAVALGRVRSAPSINGWRATAREGAAGLRDRSLGGASAIRMP